MPLMYVVGRTGCADLVFQNDELLVSESGEQK
jgi:hypothetical protein